MKYGGVPCRRKRLYIVGILHSAMALPPDMQWPPQAPTPHLDTILEHGRKLDTYVNYPFPQPLTQTAMKNIQAALVNVKHLSKVENRLPTEYPIIVDLNLTINELCRLQGLQRENMNINVSDYQMGGMLGNGFTCTVIARIVESAMKVASFPRQPQAPSQRQAESLAATGAWAATGA